MKTSVKTIILTAASIFAAMSCQKEAAVSEAENRVNTGETIQININASLGDLVAADATKATAKQVVRLEWADGDKVQAYCGTDKISTEGLTVIPSENGMFARLTGEITTTGLTPGTSVITFVYSNVANGAAANEAPTFDFSNQGDDIPFVAYATLVYDGTATLTNEMLEFKFATSVMKIAATNLAGGNITDATISGINTKVTLNPSASGAPSINEGTPGNIKTTNYDVSSDGTRAIVTFGLVPDSNTGRAITVKQGDYTNKGAITSSAIEASKSYTTPTSLFSCGKIGDHDYVLIAGTKWATQNLAITSSGQGGWMGKNEAAVNVPGTTTPVQIGDYFQWGASTNYTTEENNDKGLLIYKSFSIIFATDASSAFDASFTWKDPDGLFDTSYKSPYYESSAYANYKDKGAGLAEKDDAARILWQGTWRMPTSAEFKAMREATYWAWDGTDCGYYVFMPGLGTSGAANGNGTFDTSTDDKSKALLFFPAAGYGNTTSLTAAGTNGFYWSSTTVSSSDKWAASYSLCFGSTAVVPQNNGDCRFSGRSVRPVSD